MDIFYFLVKFSIISIKDFVYVSFFINFAETNWNHRINMLGFKSNHTPISGNVANEIRNTLSRIASGKLNSDDLKIIKDSEAALKKFDIVWEL